MPHSIQLTKDPSAVHFDYESKWYTHRMYIKKINAFSCDISKRNFQNKDVDINLN